MSEANKDEAMKALGIARKAREDGQLDRARRMADKARSLYPCAEVDSFLRTVQGGTTSSSQSRPTVRQRQPADTATSGAPSTSNGASTPDLGTPAQRKMIQDIRAAKDYYQVLGLQKDADEEDIKKAYRKLALKLHPDKCRAAGGEEAFKEVSKAFTCLTDPQKRAFYDRTGHEDMAAASAARASRSTGRTGMHSGDIDPEDLFNMMFGGMNGAFGMGPMHFGGVRQPRRRTAHPQEQAQGGVGGFAGFLNMGALLLLLVVTLFSQQSSPAVSLRPSREYPDVQHTSWHNVPYYVPDADKYEHRYPVGGANRIRLERQLEIDYRHDLMEKCRSEFGHERRMKQSVRFSNNKGKLEPMVKPACEKLNKFFDAGIDLGKT